MNRFIIAALVAVLATPGAAQTINNLGAGSAVSGTDLFPAYQGANPAKKVTATQIKTFVGGVTSISAGCGASTGGSPITTSGTIKGIATRNAQTGTSYAILDADCANVVTFSNASAVAVSIAQAGTGGNFAAGWFATLVNQGAGTATIAPTTSTIDGSANLTLATNQSVDIFTDGTNYFTARGRGSATPGGSSGQLQTNNGSGGFGAVATIATTQLPPSTVNHPGYRATGGSNSGWYTPLLQTNVAGAAPSTGTYYCSFGQIGSNSPITISNLGIRNSNSGTTNIALAIYNNDYTSGIGRPGTLAAGTGAIVNTSGSPLTGSASVQINPGFYWFCIQSGDTTFRYLASGSAISLLSTVTSLIGSTSSGSVSVANASGVSTTTGVGAVGTWAATLVGATYTETTTNLAPFVIFQVSSVP